MQPRVVTAAVLAPTRVEPAANDSKCALLPLLDGLGYFCPHFEIDTRAAVPLRGACTQGYRFSSAWCGVCFPRTTLTFRVLPSNACTTKPLPLLSVTARKTLMVLPSAAVNAPPTTKPLCYCCWQPYSTEGIDVLGVNAPATKQLVIAVGSCTQDGT